MDMGNLLYNLLSNGIEASIEVKEEKELEIVVRKADTEIEIEVENSIKESVLKKNPCLKSSKRERKTWIWNGKHPEDSGEILWGIYLL